MCTQLSIKQCSSNYLRGKRYYPWGKIFSPHLSYANSSVICNNDKLLEKQNLKKSYKNKTKYFIITFNRHKITLSNSESFQILTLHFYPYFILNCNQRSAGRLTARIFLLGNDCVFYFSLDPLYMDLNITHNRHLMNYHTGNQRYLIHWLLFSNLSPILFGLVLNIK